MPTHGVYGQHGVMPSLRVCGRCLSVHETLRFSNAQPASRCRVGRRGAVATSAPRTPAQRSLQATRHDAKTGSVDSGQGQGGHACDRVPSFKVISPSSSAAASARARASASWAGSARATPPRSGLACRGGASQDSSGYRRRRVGRTPGRRHPRCPHPAAASRAHATARRQANEPWQ
jgi:hypothetical protein